MSIQLLHFSHSKLYTTTVVVRSLTTTTLTVH